MYKPARSRKHHPLRTLTILAGGALVLLVALVGSTARGDAPARNAYPYAIALADTDSVAVDVDSLLADSLVTLDSLAADTTIRVQRYVPSWQTDQRSASLFPRKKRPLSTRVGAYWRHDIQLDSTSTNYVVREQVGGYDVRYPITISPEEYQLERLRMSLDRNWDQLIEQQARIRAQRERRGLGLNITVPGGRQSAFTTIFGKNEVDLRVTGTADITTGFSYRKSDQNLALGTGAQLDPDFRQNLRLGVVGTIGDKMQVNVNWDTQRQFEFENQLRLQYQGYDDEILQRIEAGNVTLQTPFSLIRGGLSLFGIYGEARVGAFTLKTIVSQQQGQANSLSLEGGSETTPFNLKPTDYDERTHYFLSYYFRNRWEEALSNPPTILVDGQFERITDIEVWKLQPVAPEEQNVRNVVGMVDLGEEPELLLQADDYQRPLLPDYDRHQYTDEQILTRLRPGDQVPKDLLESSEIPIPLTPSDYQEGKFKRLELGRDYILDNVLGYITLRQRLAETEALAVAFRFLASGTERQVGDFSTETGGGDNSQVSDRLVLKLLKPVNLKQPANLGDSDESNPAAWYLELKNIYQLGRGLQPTDFNLDITLEPPGQPSSRTFPEVGTETLLELLGLDRVNEDGAPKPDDKFDYLPNYSIDPGEGKLIFPYLEPFGNHLDSLITTRVPEGPDRDELRLNRVFRDLYTMKQENARRNTQLDIYRVQGDFTGSIQAFYDLKAFSGVVEGSVRVTSGGSELTEGADYTVDYLGGTLTITNPVYLVAGRDIEIDYEQNALINFQKKTQLGALLEYNPNPRIQLNSMIMRLSQKSLTDKFRLGEEPVANTIWGIHGKADFEPRWLTRAIDAIPLIQTKAPSLLALNGEFAQLLPGHTVTPAFKDTRRQLQGLQDSRDFNDDELGGLSYLDDFDGFQNTLPLMQPGPWRLSSEPVTLAEDDTTGIERTMPLTSRGTLAWYQLNQNTFNDLGGDPNDPAVKIYAPTEIFPDREVTGQERTHLTFDMFFSPHERGPYNLTQELGQFLDTPKDAWGGMTLRLSEGYTDFTLQNIEFVEFIFQPFPYNTQKISEDARLYVDLGLISEDVIPDNKLNTEDGLSTNEPGGAFSDFPARLSTGQQTQIISPIKEGDNITEDLGLDGLASFAGNKFAGTDGAEEVQYADFLNSLDNQSSSSPFLAQEIAKARRDPSGDDYHYFLDDNYFTNSQYYPQGSALQQRFTRFFAGHELNSFEAQSKLAPDASRPQGNSRSPDNEDLNLNSAIDTENSFFQYDIPLNRDELDRLAQPDEIDDYVVEKIEGTGWYLVRMPVKDFERRLGEIQDFTRVESMRIWTAGHEAPVTMRFAKLELVGSQWRKSETVSLESDSPLPPPDNPLNETRLSIENINNEENRSTYSIPNGTVRTQFRDPTGGRRDAREQSLVLRVENLQPGQQQAIFQTYNQAQDLLKYSNLRMFVHMHGQMEGGRELQAEDRGVAKLFVRLGANETSDYYEYEQPLTPSPLDFSGITTSEQKADYLWRTRELDPETNLPRDVNSMNIVLGVLNQLKFVRDDLVARSDTIFWNDENGVLEETVASFAPPGARIGIKGTPSLGRVNTIVIGLRNPDGTNVILENTVLWVNELRTAGYDEQRASGALLNADFQLADLGRVKANFRRQTDGFGSLSSTLADRAQTSVQDWAINATLNMDKFIPERFGWAIPITMEVKENQSTPRFDPNRGDVKVEDLLSAIDASEILAPEEKELKKQEVIEGAQSLDRTRSFSARVAKSGSRSRLWRNTVDGLSLSYSYTDTDGRTPRQQLRTTWRWSTTVGYRLTVRRPRVFRPFGWLGDVPILRALGGLRFNYLPNSLNFTLNAARNFTESKDRPDPLRVANENTLPLDVEFPLRAKHAFTHGRQFGLQYNPFNFLNLGFDTNTNLSLNAAGVDTSFSVILRDTLGQETRFDNTRLQDLLNQGVIDSTDINKNAFELESPVPLSIGQTANRYFSGDDRVRPENHTSQFNIAFRPQLQRISALNWITVQDISYGSQFSWRNGPVANNAGAAVSTNVTIRGGLTMRPQSLFQKFTFYRNMEEKHNQRIKDKSDARRERDEDRKQRKEQRKQEKEARKQAKETGEEVGEAEQPAEGETPEQQEQPQQDQPKQKSFNEADLAAQQDSQDATDQAAESAKKKGSKFSPVPFFRTVFLAVTGIRDLSLTYNGTRRTEASNVGVATRNEIGDITDVAVHYSLLDAFNGKGVSLGYRLGLERDIPLANRVLDTRLQVTDAFTDQDRLQGRTTLNPTQSLQITLNWSVEQTSRDNITFRQHYPHPDSVLRTPTESGGNRASVWAFGASYESLFRTQLQTYTDDYNATPEGERTIIGDANGDGRVALTNNTVFDDFRNHYLFSSSTIGQGGRLPFPLPNWTINYRGISNWPIFRRITQSASLRHQYGVDYNTDFRSKLDAGDTLSFPLGPSRLIEYEVPFTEISTVRVNERFQPLIALDMSFGRNLTTGIAWNKSNTYSLSTSNNSVSETKANELSFTSSYQRQGMRLPFFKGKRLNNRITFSLTFSYTVNDDRQYSIRRALEAAAQLESPEEFDPKEALQDPYVSILTSTKRLLSTPKVTYQFSNQVTADAFVTYERFIGDNRRPSATNVNGGFNIRVSISN